MGNKLCVLMVMAGAAAVALMTQAGTGDAVLDMRFDMGTLESPVKEGFVQVTPETVYSAERGYGWERKPSRGTDSTDHMFEYWGQKHRAVNFVLGVDDVTVDCVSDPESLAFRIDLPNGAYDVGVWVGNLSVPLARISVLANGKPVKEDFDSRTLWWHTMETEFGAYRLVRSRVKVTDGKLEIEVNGDREAETEHVEKPVGSAAQMVKLVSRMAFTEVAVQGIEVHSVVEPRLAPADGKLATHRSDAPEEVRAFVEAFNGGDYRGALEKARLIDGERWPLFKAEALMWIAGRPELEKERELLPEIIGMLKGEVGDDADGLLARKLLWDAELLWRSVKAFYDYSYTYTGLGFRQQIGRTEALLTQLDDPDGPMYWKAKFYLARSTCLFDPMRWVWWYERGQEMFRELEKEFPDNKYVRLYLDDEYRTIDALKGIIPEPRTWKGWEVPTYREGTEGAPEWAVYMREEFARSIDLIDWWIDNRQLENGEIGGGWGDDVEFVPYWAFVGMISDGASGKVMKGTRKLVDGVWNSDEVNQDEGFASLFTWVKPASELVAYSQPMMITADYGNPRYVERAMKTTKFLRDFATGINERGHRHFKSAYLNATRLGDEEWMEIDAPLCFRPAFGGAALCWYNNSPEAVGLMTEWLDSWYEDSLRTDKGKPRGIFPAAVAFETDELGGPGKENWYDGSREGLALDSFTWPAYQDYLYDMFTQWYLRTGEDRYTEPMAALVDIAQHYFPGSDDPLPEGTYPWFEQTVHPRFMESARFQGRAVLNAKLMLGTERYDDYLRAHVQSGIGIGPAGGYPRFLLAGDRTEFAEIMERSGRDLRSRWPFLTTEAGMTDRMGIPGFFDLFFAATGGDASVIFKGLPFHAVTYENTTKNFAAMVREHGRKDLQLWIYSFLPEDREVGIRLWRLEVGGAYELKAGPDTDENWEMDEVGTAKEFVLEHRGDSVRFNLPSRQLQVVEVKQTKAPAARIKSMPDLGISDEDVFWMHEGELAVKVHNIGNKAARNVLVKLWAGEGDEKEEVGEAMVSYLESPLTLDPQTKLVSFLVEPEQRNKKLTVAIDPDDEIYEITERNNTFRLEAEPAPE